MGSTFLTISVKAYPHFIGYGYSSCITCHYSGSGGGALNDYGRALFTNEIAARDIYDDKISDEELSARSGFLGATPLPWWLRPGFKYRGLWMRNNPGSAKNQVDRYINMQTDLNLNFFFDKKQKVTLVTTTSYADRYPPYPDIQKWSTYSKEYYLRWKMTNTYWLYVGQMDKTFGIRDADHTAVHRSPLRLGQFDQSLGAIFHITYPEWDVALNYFVGNAKEPKTDKQQGLAMTGEYQLVEKLKIGASFLSSSSESTAWNIFSMHTRIGLDKGSSFLAEAGLKQKKNKTITTTDKTPLGSYVWLSSMVNLRRGYNVLSNIEFSRDDMNKTSDENYRWSLGTIFFPMPRTEVRLMAVNGKTFSEGGASEDSWQLQSQFHVSY
ncbi:hypothetical protein CIK05_15475 [Bdellovibrio sp. qaytius]|nr:hypothetical protein CIK05_15475 [Bdellovibrio sp. qaytius]